MNLKDIEAKTGPNPGGSVRLWLIPWANVSSVPAPDQDGVITSNIVLKDGARWHRFEFSPGRCRLQNPAAGQQGSYWFDTAIDVAVPGDDQENMNVFEGMINGLFLALIDQAGGVVKLAGTLSSPLICKVAHDHGGDNNDFRGATFEFRSKGFLPREYAGSIQEYSLLWRVKEDTVFCVQE